MAEKKPRTVYFTAAIIEAIEKAAEESKTGEKKNQIILNCIVHGLKDLYNIEV